jgi:plasmid maintenance system antidote protein VapI
LRGVEVAVDELKAQAAAAREFYKEEEVKVVIQEGFNRVYEELTSNADLTADDQKKLSDAANKYYQMWVNIQGKAGSITETRSTDSMDENLQELLNIERAKNLLRDKEESPESVLIGQVWPSKS